jgi:hypothetical protein
VKKLFHGPSPFIVREGYKKESKTIAEFSVQFESKTAGPIRTLLSIAASNGGKALFSVLPEVAFLPQLPANFVRASNPSKLCLSHND